jgi:tRNA-specific 2-thiouridylase
MKPVVAIALSGGIDSLMSAYLLKQQGFNVIGIHFITGYEIQASDSESIPGSSNTQTGISSAVKSLAEHKIAHLSSQLDIEIKLIDCSTEFKQTVVDYFARTYQMGQTPNPCMVCNPFIKFGTILDSARKSGAEFLATGHYARVRRDPNGRFHLMKGIDSSKDQSYFLALLNPQQLARARFPLGEMTKADVIKLADQKGFTPATQGESQDICFVKGLRYGEFLAVQPGFEPRPGPIQDTSGKILGQHEGLHLFTVGQRRGINCPAAEPYYVVGMDQAKNLLEVGLKKDLLASECKAIDINWIQQPPARPMKVHTRVRYRHEAAASTVIPVDDNAAIVRFETPQSAITPGQCAVFYRDDEILGGGWIELDA